MAKLKATTMELGNLIPDPNNAREHTGANLETIASSLRRLGAGRSLVLDKDNVVRAGNGTLQAAKQAGFQKVTVIEAEGDELIAIKRGDWTDEEATAYALVDNQATELSSWSNERLKPIMRELMENAEANGGLASVIGFNEKQLEKFMTPDEPVEVDVNFTATVDTTPNCTCPKCGFQWRK